MNRRIFLKGLTCLGSLSAVGWPLALGKAVPLSKHIRSELNDYVERGTLVGAVTLVAKRGHIVILEAAGYRSLQAREPLLTDAIFDIRSMTKPITALAVMTLVEEGKIALSDPLARFLPQFQNTKVKDPSGKFGSNPSATPITIRHLLTHTSGIPMQRPSQLENITRTSDPR